MKKSEVFVYIAGKYSDKDMLSTELNIIEAQKIAIKCAKRDIFYICPHTHSRLMDYYAPEVTWEYWMALDLKLIETACNCMILVENFETSKGALVEKKKAEELGYPVYIGDTFFTWYDSLED